MVVNPNVNKQKSLTHVSPSADKSKIEKAIKLNIFIKSK